MMSPLSTLVIAIGLIGITHGFIGNDIFQTEDEDLMEIFCVDDAAGLEAIGQTTWTTQEITRNGIKKAIISFFREHPQEGHPFNPDPNASLSEIFQAYYGDCASTDRFLKSVQTIVDAAVDLDSRPVIKDDPKYHFDNEKMDESQRLLIQRYSQIVTTSVDGNFIAARTFLGQNLHTVQKFYAHSNYVELSPDAICEGLGLPGYTVCGEVALQNSTCDESCEDLDIDQCTDNTITTALTSGYFDMDEAPAGTQKCSHGSLLDESLDNPGHGGINKDTSTPCFSPHYHLHSAAASLATDATDSYISEIREAIGEDNFMSLFDLSMSSALAIMIDTSSSMGDEINAVQQEVADIIDAANNGGIIPSLYVLAAYESTVELTVTKDDQEFLDAVNALYPGGGTEYFYAAAQRALTNSPPYSNIIAFTDEKGDDEELLNTVLALAEDLQTKITVIWTGSPSEVPGLTAFKEITSKSGGLLLEFEKTSIEDIISILARSIESSQATLNILNNLSGPNDVSFPIDAFQRDVSSRVEVQVSGEITKATLNFAGAEMVDLFDDDSISSSGLDIQVLVRSDAILDITFRPSAPGDWSFGVDSGSNTYDVSITASCTHSFLPAFKYLEKNATHPNLRGIGGRPIARSTPFISVEITSAKKEFISAVTGLSLVSEKGDTIHTYPTKKQEFQEMFIVDTSEFPLPDEPFYLRLEGKDDQDFSFWRIFTTLISPSSTSVDITANSTRLEGRPGDTIQAEYMVTNFGIETQITMDVSDDQNYLSDVDPPTYYLATNQSAIVTVTFVIPTSAIVGTVSTITVTAVGELDGSQNSVLSSLVVVSKDEDFTPPECSFISIDQCSSDGQTTCADESWTFESIVSDAESGLGTIRVEAANGTTSIGSNFAIGTNENVSVSFESDCCTRTAKLTVLDVVGNHASCNVDQGPLKDCGKLFITEVTATSISVRWTRPCGEWEVELYDFSMVSLLDNEPDYHHIVRGCTDFNCTDVITGIRSCMDYQLSMVAKEFQPGTGVEQYRDLTARTYETVTSEPISLKTTDASESSVTLRWSPPTHNRECVDHYRVCHRLLPAREAEECQVTETVNQTETAVPVEHTVDGLQPCANYHFSVKAVTPNGRFSKISIIDKYTNDAEPGDPSNFSIIETHATSLTLAWNNPEMNPRCVKSYTITCMQLPSFTDSLKEISPFGYARSSATYDHTEIVTGLQMCQAYNCSVYASGPSSFPHSATVFDTATTVMDGVPSAPVGVESSASTATSISVSWVPPDVAFHCIDSILVSWQNDILPADKGSIVLDSKTEAVDLVDLVACSPYTITVQAVANGTTGEAAELKAATKDRAPGPATDLTVRDMYQDGFMVSWADPTVDPQCARYWDWTTSEHGRVDTKVKSFLPRETHEVTETGLNCDSTYTFTVWAYSASNDAGPKREINVATRPCDKS